MPENTGSAGASPLPESPIVASSFVGPAVLGTSVMNVGVSGKSIPPAPAPNTVTEPAATLASDGVLGEGKTGVHGVSALDNGVLGENSATGFGVAGTSSKGTGVHGVNGAGSATTPKFGCGVWGESTDGYGLYGASKTASGVFGTSGPGHFAGEFDGDVSITGDVGITGDLTLSASATLTGSITAADVIITGADCAEEFDIRHAEAIDPGSVVVFDDGGALNLSEQPYNKRVAGVISGAGAYRPGVVLDRRVSDRARAPVALVGKVYCKVDASYGAIEVGDLLTTSATVGCAMKATDSARACGAVIGKALAPHRDGRGLIPILVTLQ
jgi:hypothetical protein